MRRRRTKDECAAMAATCKTKTEFYRTHCAYYSAAKRYGWLADICGHMPTYGGDRVRKWTEFRIKDVVSKYSDFKQFVAEQPSLYQLLRRKGRARSLTGHMRRRKARNGHWTKVACAAEARRYKNRTDFVRGCVAGYDAAHRNGWLDDICTHMKARGDHYKRVVYIMRATGTKTVYIGLTFNPSGRHSAHKRRPARNVAAIVNGPHSFKVLTPLIPTESAQAIERELINRFRTLGWDVVNVNVGGGPGGGVGKWSFESLRAVAMQYGTRTEMARARRDAYLRASRLNLLDSIFSDHPNHGFDPNRRQQVETFDEMQAIVADYRSRRAFELSGLPAYQVARKRGWMDALFANHENNGYRKRPQWTLEDVIRAAAGMRTPSEFRRNNKLAYRAAMERGLIKQLFPPHQKG